MKIAFAVLSALSICLPAFGQTSEILGVKTSPIVRGQYRTPWCYAMASRTLLEQVICEANKTCATAQAPDVAIAGVISAQIDQRQKERKSLGATASTSWFVGGDQKVTLQEIAQQGQITTGSCTHEKELFVFHRDPLANASQFDLSMQLEIIYQGFQQSFARLSPAEQKLGRSANAGLWLEKLARSTGSRSMLFLRAALAKAKSLEEFAKLTLYPENCQTQTISLPRFRVVSYAEADPLKIEKLIEIGLQKQRLITLSVCAAKLSDQVTEECGAHAVVVSQSRINCHSGACEKEYRFLDSSFFAKSPQNADGSYWLPASMVHGATQAFYVYQQKTLGKIKADLDLQITQILGNTKKALIDFETFVINMKVSNLQAIDDFRAKMAAIKAETRSRLAHLSKAEIAEAIRQNPNVAVYLDDAAFNKMIDGYAKTLSVQLEQVRTQQEAKLIDLRASVAKISSQLNANFMTSMDNIIWLE